MRITQTTIQKTFEVEHEGETYYVDFLNSDGQILGLMNRDYFEITTDDGEPFDDHIPASATRQEKARARARGRIANEIIRHVMRHFNDMDKELTEHEFPMWQRGCGE